MADNLASLHKAPPSSPQEPWCVALARRVTRGDPKFMDLVRRNPLEKSRKFAFERIRALETPYVLARCLANQIMEEPDDERFQWLLEELGIDRSTTEYPWRLVDLLKRRFLDEMGAMLKEKMAGQLEIYAAPVDLRRSDEDHNEDFNQKLPQFAVTETAYFGDDDGLLHQSPTSTAAWRCYAVSTKDAPHEQPTDQRSKPRNGFPQYILKAAQEYYPDGIPEGTNAPPLKRALEPFLLKIQELDKTAVTVLGPRAFSRALKLYPRVRATTDTGKLPAKG